MTTPDELRDALVVVCDHGRYLARKAPNPEARAVGWALCGSLAYEVPVDDSTKDAIVALLGELADGPVCECGECGGAKVPPAARLVLDHLFLIDRWEGNE